LSGGKLTNECAIEESNKIKKRILNYYWHGDALVFKGLTIPKLGEQQQIIEDMHAKLGHFSK